MPLEIIVWYLKFLGLGNQTAILDESVGSSEKLKTENQTDSIISLIFSFQFAMLSIKMSKKYEKVINARFYLPTPNETA